MSKCVFTNRPSSVGLMATIATIVAFLAAPTWAGDCCSSRGNSGAHSQRSQTAQHDHADHRYSGVPSAAVATPPSHGGQVHATDLQRFEVVYLSDETRVYLFGIDGRPLSPRGAKGRVSMRVRGNDRVYRYDLRPFAANNGTRSDEFLVAPIDVSRIRDGDMTVTFDLSQLPTPQQPEASFSQTFALAQSRPIVTVVALAGADHDGIIRQGTCPVSGGQLGSMGTPVKLLVGNHPVYLCCMGCVGKVKEHPERYASNRPPLTRLPATSTPDKRLTAAKVTAADQMQVQAQRTCPVTNARLGSMGTPIKVTRGAESLFLCCHGCDSKVEKNPDYYFARAAQMRAAQ